MNISSTQFSQGFCAPPPPQAQTSLSELYPRARSLCFPQSERSKIRNCIKQSAQLYCCVSCCMSSNKYTNRQTDRQTDRQPPDIKWAEAIKWNWHLAFDASSVAVYCALPCFLCDVKVGHVKWVETNNLYMLRIWHIYIYIYIYIYIS
jgi:hypothetical protein